MKQQSKAKRGENNGLAQLVLDSAKPGYPKPLSLSETEEREIAQLIESKITPYFKEHEGERSTFNVEMKEINDLMKAFIKSHPVFNANPFKAKAAKRVGVTLAKDWVTFIRNSELLKLGQESMANLSK